MLFANQTTRKRYGNTTGFQAQRKKLRGKNKCFIFAVKKFYDYET